MSPSPEGGPIKYGPGRPRKGEVRPPKVKAAKVGPASLPTEKRKRGGQRGPRPSRRKYDSAEELYDSVVERGSRTIQAASRKGRDIFPCPEIKDRERRDRAKGSLKTFLETYFPGTFTMGWSEDHLAIIAKLETVIESGGQYALAAPRGGGKTAITERAALWAVLTGRRRFVVIVAANEYLAERSLTRLKSELEHNPLLLEDWPKAAYPIKKLESQARRAVGQLYDGKRTCITWQQKLLILPTMPGPDNEASGAIIQVGGLGGAIRGLSAVNAEGETVRPDLLLCDDPQDRDSARSVIQTSERLAILTGDLLGLAGPGQKIAALAILTVILKNDLADQLLDSTRNPVWQGEKYKLVYEWAGRADLWEEYAKLRTEGFYPGGDRGLGAMEFYRSHQELMDAGVRVAWPERFDPGELSAVQNAYNLRADRGEPTFWSEYQNEPPDTTAGVDALDPVAISGRLNGFERGVCPPEVEKLTAFVDVGGGLLWWLVAGWDESFGCSVIDYGCWPEQQARVFLARNASPTLEDLYKQAGGVEGLIYRGLEDLVARLVKREWLRSDGASLSLSRILIDAGWQTDAVRLFIRQSEHAKLLTPSKGLGIGPGQTAISDYHRKPGEKIGDGWILGLAGSDRLRLLRFDANHWKTRIASMLTRPMGLRGGVTLYGQRAIDHELLALQLCSEFPTRHEARGNAVNIWTRRPDRDNHLLDAIVGAGVAASLEGLSPLTTLGATTQRTGTRKRVSFAELQRQARERRGQAVP